MKLAKDEIKRLRVGCSQRIWLSLLGLKEAQIPRELAGRERYSGVSLKRLLGVGVMHEEAPGKATRSAKTSWSLVNRCAAPHRQLPTRERTPTILRRGRFALLSPTTGGRP